MKTLLIALFIILCAIGVGYAMHQDPGYILIAYRHTTLEMTLWFGLIALIVALLLLRFIWLVLSGIIGFPKYMKLKSLKKASTKNQDLLQEALTACVDGQYQKAIQSFKKREEYTSHSLLNYLGASFALKNNGEDKACSLLLEKALEKIPEHTKTIYYMQAQLFLSSGCYKRALEALETIEKKYRSQDLWVMLAMRCYVGLWEWKKAYTLYPQFSNLHLLQSCEVQSTYQSIIIGCLGSYAMNDLEDFWSSLQKSEKKNETYVWLLADRYIENNYFELAAKMIMQHLKIEFSEDLWELLISCVKDQRRSIASFCEKQLRQHDNQWIIYYCAGIASLNEGNLNQTKNFFTKSIALKPTEHALSVLADIYHRQGLEIDFQQSCLQLIQLHQSENTL